MDKIISFGKGIRRQPSIGEDGELSELVNLIPKNGELVNVRPMKKVGVAVAGTLLAVHKVGDAINYITWTKVTLEGSTVYDLLGNGALVFSTSSEIKSAIVMGNVLVVNCADEMRYVVWDKDESAYKPILRNIGFRLAIRQKKTESGTVTAELAESYPDLSSGSATFDEAQSRSLFNEVDTLLNEAINSKDVPKEWHKYVTVGIAVLRLYDGTYIAFSDVFTLDPMTSKHGLVASISGGTLTATKAISQYEISVNLRNVTEADLDMLMGVDIFLSKSTAFVDLDNPGIIKANSLFNLKKADGIVEELSEMQFYKSISISAEDLNDEKTVMPLSVTGVEESLDPTALSAYTYSADSTFVYNNRLHLASVNSRHIDMSLVERLQNTVAYASSERMGYYNRVSDAYTNVDEILPIAEITPSPDAPSVHFSSLLEVEAVIEVDIDDPNTGFSTNRYTTDTLRYPLPPILSYPSMYAKEMRLYIKLDDAVYKRVIKMTPSTRGNISYAANVDSSGLGYNQINTVTLTIEDGSITRVNKAPLWSQWLRITNFDEVKQRKPSSIGSRDNILKYSNSGNPFVFPAINTVAIGDGVIKGVSSASKALSEGQFGQFPLYAFCSDGIWALEVAGDGSYSAKQPVSRDVCNNARSITQIDGAVIFTTDQGLKIIQGSEVALLSEKMNGHNINEGDFFESGFFRNYGHGEYDELSSPSVDDFRAILKDCQIAYDYPDNLLYVYNPNGTKWFVYSLLTSEFSSIVGNGIVYSVVPGYPTPLIQVDSRLYTFGNEVDNNTLRNGLLLTRPIDMGEPFAMKKLHDMKLHYTKHNKEKGAFVKVVVYASNDGEHWYVLPSMRKRAFKYYRVALITKMTDNDALSGMIMRYELERTNKIR